jgi:sugar/nucleoside kinase (ribokinase family)
VSVLVVGSVAFDTIETASERRVRILGGSANFACAAASHFCPALMVGIVGSDYPAGWFERLGRHRVDTRGVARAEGESFFWEGVYSEDFSSRRTVETRLGVFERFSPDLPEAFRSPRIAFLGNIAPALQRRVMEQLEPGVAVAMDTMNLWLDTVPDEVLALVGRVQILLVNDEEARQMTGEAHPLDAARRLSAMGPRTVVVKCGAEGAHLVHGGEALRVPCFPVARVVDPTGAGDSFAGAFLGVLARDGEGAVASALVNAAALASWTVEHFEPGAVLDLAPAELARRVSRIEGDVGG